MNITILPAGYVGLVTGACLADFALDVKSGRLRLLCPNPTAGGTAFAGNGVQR